MRNKTIAFLVVVAALVGSLSAQVFPVDWDDSEEVAVSAVLSPVDAITLDAVRFNVLNESPFTCDADAVGFVYLQLDINEAFGGSDHALCLCKADDLQAVTVTYTWINLAGSQDCTNAF